MKFPITPKSINALAFSRLILTYIINNNIINITVIIRKSSLRFFTI